MGATGKKLGDFENSIGQNVAVYTALVNAAKNTTAALIATPGAGKQIWVLGADLLCLAIGTVTFKDSGGTALSGVYTVAANQQITWPMTPNINFPWLIVTTNKGLSATLSINTDLDGVITYAIVTL